MKTIKGMFSSKSGKSGGNNLIGIISGLKGSGTSTVEKWLHASGLLKELDHHVNVEIIAHGKEFDRNKYSLLIFVIDLEKPENNIACNQWFHTLRRTLSDQLPCLVLANKKDCLPEGTTDDEIIEDTKSWLKVNSSHLLSIKPISAKRLLDNVNFKGDNYSQIFSFIKEHLNSYARIAVQK